MALAHNEIKKGFIWNAVEMYAGQIVQFVIGIIMARLLTPDDYGIIAMITMFLCLSNSIIGAGFPTALLRKNNCTQVDLSTIFFTNCAISIVLYFFLWIASPWIADFYSQPLLVSVTRAMGITFVIGSLGAVSETILKKELRFKTIATITLIVQIVTGGIAIFFAYNGSGVWALVLQSIFGTCFRAILVIYKTRWFPNAIFSVDSFRELFGFGSKVLGSNIITQLYSNMYSLLIGRFFTPASVGFFTRADGYSRLIPINIAGVIQKTLFPMLAKIQDDETRLVDFNNRMTKITSFIIFPASMIMAGMSYPIISVMLTDKWIATAPLLQILCISILPEHLYYINNDFIMIKGYSGLVMKEQFWSKTLSIIILILTIPLGLKWIAVGKGIGAFITWIFSAVYLKTALGIKPIHTIKNLSAMICVSIVLGIASYLIFLKLSYTFINVLLVGLGSCLLYYLCAKTFFPSTLSDILNLRK